MNVANGQKSSEDIIKERYIRNYLFLKEKLPQLLEEINKPSEVEWSIKIGADGSINAVINGEELYPYDPKLIAKAQVDEFSRNPTRIITPYLPYPNTSMFPLHDGFLSKMVEGFYPLRLDNVNFKFDGKLIPIIIVFGMGFGYHIIELIRRFNISHMIILEPDPLFAKLSLYTIDWREIFKYFSKSGKSLDIIVSDDPEAIKDNLITSINSANPALGINTFIFSHFKSPFFDEVIDFLKMEGPINPNLWGIIDSELSTLRHVIANVSLKLPVYMGIKPLNEDIPVILIGSGPSLDKLKDFIQKNIEKALVVSCGTATKSLYRMGIKPDIHTVADWQAINYDLLRDIDRRYMKDIYVIGGALAHPGIFRLGKRAGMFIIHNSTIADTLFPRNVARVKDGIPTVTAATFSLFASMGFRRFYLVGIDLGTRTPEVHHSKFSDYYSHDSPLYNKETGYNIEVEANFGGKAFTKQSFYVNKRNMERTIKKYNLEVYNLSDGAKIEGAAPAYPEDISLRNEIDKDRLMKNIFVNFRSTYLRETNLRRIVEKMVEDLDRLISILKPKLSHGVKDLEDLVELFSEINPFIITTSHLFFLIGASIYRYQMFILSASYIREEEIEKITDRAIPVFIDYLETVRKELADLLKSSKL